MKYILTSYLDSKQKQEVKNKGLFCYDTRHDDFGNWGEPTTIEQSVLVNRCGSIIIEKELNFNNNNPTIEKENYFKNGYIDFEDFAKENQYLAITDQEEGNLYISDEPGKFEEVLECIVSTLEELAIEEKFEEYGGYIADACSTGEYDNTFLVVLGFTKKEHERGIFTKERKKELVGAMEEWISNFNKDYFKEPEEELEKD